MRSSTTNEVGDFPAVYSSAFCLNHGDAGSQANQQIRAQSGGTAVLSPIQTNQRPGYRRKR